MKGGPTGSPSHARGSKSTRHVRGAPEDPDTYTSGLPRAMKVKSKGSTCKGGESSFQRNNADWSKTTTWEIKSDMFLE